MLAFWKADDTFQASIDNRPAGENGANEFVFYDGPPFANGLPHYGHLLTGYVKDIVPRYQTMRGRRVERRFGWDCHGLPAELEAQRQLGLKTKDEIEEMGIETFNAACRDLGAAVHRRLAGLRHPAGPLGRLRARLQDPRRHYMESVLWAFKSLYDKGLVYEGLRVLPYCWNDETPLSNHELRMDDEVYQNRQDPAVTVGCRLETGELALIWTTTPVDPAEQPGDRGRAGHRLRRGARHAEGRARSLLRRGPAGRVRAASSARTPATGSSNG